MFTSRVEIVSFLAAASLMDASASSASTFSYDPTSEFGPSKWGALEIDGNACNGESNSPIAVETSRCTRFENYSLSVSTVKGGMFKDGYGGILLSLTPTLLVSSFFIERSFLFSFRTENVHSRTSFSSSQALVSSVVTPSILASDPRLKSQESTVNMKQSNSIFTRVPSTPSMATILALNCTLSTPKLKEIDLPSSV